MWSQGAVVVIKRGRKDIADAIENGISIQKPPFRTEDDIQRKMRIDKTMAKISEARVKYSISAKPKSHIQKIVDGIEIGYAIVICGADYLANKTHTLVKNYRGVLINSNRRV